MNALELRGLRKEYKDFTLDNIDLTIPAGSILGLIGENGAGKSTTIKLILDMISRDGGTVSIYGHDNRECFPLGREDIGVVLDETGFSECLTAAVRRKGLERSLKCRVDVQVYEDLKSVFMQQGS